MPSTLTGVGASATQTTSPTLSVPADGDSLAASGVQGPFQSLLNHVAKVWGVVAGLAALATAQTWTALQTFSSGIAMGGAKVTGLGAPTAGSTDAATAAYAESKGVRAWAVLSVGAAGAVTVAAGSGVASATWSAADLTVTLSPAMPSANYVVIAQELNNVQIFMTMNGFPSTTSFVVTGAKSTANVTFTGGEQIRIAVLGG